jgi:hypothetical protein
MKSHWKSDISGQEQVWGPCLVYKVKSQNPLALINDPPTEIFFRMPLTGFWPSPSSVSSGCETWVRWESPPSSVRIASCMWEYQPDCCRCCWNAFMARGLKNKRESIYLLSFFLWPDRATRSGRSDGYRNDHGNSNINLGYLYTFRVTDIKLNRGLIEARIFYIAKINNAWG